MYSVKNNMDITVNIYRPDMNVILVLDPNEERDNLTSLEFKVIKIYANDFNLTPIIKEDEGSVSISAEQLNLESDRNKAEIDAAKKAEEKRLYDEAEARKADELAKQKVEEDQRKIELLKQEEDARKEEELKRAEEAKIAEAARLAKEAEDKKLAEEKAEADRIANEKKLADEAKAKKDEEDRLAKEAADKAKKDEK